MKTFPYELSVLLPYSEQAVLLNTCLSIRFLMISNQISWFFLSTQQAGLLLTYNEENSCLIYLYGYIFFSESMYLQLGFLLLSKWKKGPGQLQQLRIMLLVWFGHPLTQYFDWDEDEDGRHSFLFYLLW